MTHEIQAVLAWRSGDRHHSLVGEKHGPRRKSQCVQQQPTAVYPALRPTPREDFKDWRLRYRKCSARRTLHRGAVSRDGTNCSARRTSAAGLAIARIVRHAEHFIGRSHGTCVRYAEGSERPFELGPPNATPASWWNRNARHLRSWANYTRIYTANKSGPEGPM
jgi:hypothetical protein